MISRIKEFIKKENIEILYLDSNILIMPKLKHISNFDFNFETFSGSIILHPRELDMQRKFLGSFNYLNLIENGLDFFALTNRCTVFDFGTSVSLLAPLFGSKVIFDNQLSHQLLYHPDDYFDLLAKNFFSAEHPSYDEYGNFVLKSIGLNHDK